MQSTQDEKDLAKFLSKVNEIDSIIKDMKSDDVTVQTEAMEKADMKLEEKQGFDRSVINKNAYKDDDKEDGIKPITFPNQHTDQDVFLHALEADANKRAKARKERHAKANLVKDEGNIFFKQGDFENGIELYTNAISIAKDLPSLYTNRAAAFIQIGKFQEAIDDCDFSLRIDDQWIKAFTFKARALHKQRKYDEAVKTFEEIIEIDKTKTKAVKGFIDEVLKEKELFEQESSAKLGVEKGNVQAEGIVKVIASLLAWIEEEKVIGIEKVGGLMYFAGGFRVLQDQLHDDQSRTLFRTENGFDIFTKPGCIRNCMMSRLNNQNLHHASDLVCAALSLCHHACLNVPENRRVFISKPDVPNMLLSYLEWPEEQVKRSTINFIHEASLDETSRFILYKYMDCPRLCKLLLKPKTRKADLNSSSAASLCNFALDQKFRICLQSNFESELLDLFQEHMLEVGVNSYEALSLRMRFLLHLIKMDQVISNSAANNDQFMNGCYNALERCTALFKNGLTQPCAMEEILEIFEITLSKSDLETLLPTKLITLLIPMIMKSKDKELVSKSMSVVIKSIEVSEDGHAVFVNEGRMPIFKQMVKFLKQKDLRKKAHSLKLLCLLGQANPTHLKAFVSLDKGGSLLYNILKDDSDESAKLNQGHVALLLGSLALLPGGLDPILSNNLEGDVVRQLLVLCRDSENKVARTNCAIALGKMAKSDNRFLIELRKHDGINILAHNQCVSELA